MNKRLILNLNIFVLMITAPFLLINLAVGNTGWVILFTLAIFFAVMNINFIASKYYNPGGNK